MAGPESGPTSRQGTGYTESASLIGTSVARPLATFIADACRCGHRCPGQDSETISEHACAMGLEGIVRELAPGASRSKEPECAGDKPGDRCMTRPTAFQSSRRRRFPQFRASSLCCGRYRQAGIYVGDDEKRNSPS